MDGRDGGGHGLGEVVVSGQCSDVAEMDGFGAHHFADGKGRGRENAAGPGEEDVARSVLGDKGGCGAGGGNGANTDGRHYNRGIVLIMMLKLCNFRCKGPADQEFHGSRDSNNWADLQAH